MGKLTTHVLDLVNGCPGRLIGVNLYRLLNDERVQVGVYVTNSDGRVDSPLLEGEKLITGIYELEFHAGDYFRLMGMEQQEPAFLNEIVIRFGISDATQHYHVPLLLSKYGYSTYRGS